MKINKINYISAVYFFMLFVSVYLLIAIAQFIVEIVSPGFFSAQGLMTPTFLSSIIYAPLLGGLIGYLFVAFAILIYNCVAKKFPITLKVSKK